MRPYLSFHSNPGAVLDYLTHPRWVEGVIVEPEIIGGTVAWRGASATLEHLRELPRPKCHERNVIHLTLSLPTGLRLDRRPWNDVVCLALQGLSLPWRSIPWLSSRHSDKTCDHVHILAIAMTFTGRGLTLPPLREACDRTHVALCRHLSIEPPRYHVPATGPRAQIFLPARRHRTEHLRAIAARVQSVLLKTQPETSTALIAALEADGSGVSAELKLRDNVGSVWVFKKRPRRSTGPTCRRNSRLPR